jgi:hypothetical protein
MIDELEFRCPRCGSSHFGTGFIGQGDVKNAPATEFEGECHGYVRTEAGTLPCSFTWNRGREDSKYMHPTGRKIPKYGVAQTR